jgi:hypothetical protein
VRVLLAFRESGTAKNFFIFFVHRIFTASVEAAFTTELDWLKQNAVAACLCPPRISD